MTNLLYSDDESDLRSAVRAALDRIVAADDIAALYDDPARDVTDIWRSLGFDMGLAGLLVPDQYGGAGAGAREAAVVLEEFGRSLAPTPFLTSAVIGARVLTAVDAAAELTALAAGDATACVVLPWSVHRGHWSPVSGPVRAVAGALEADVFLVPRSDGLALLTPEEVSVEPLTSLDMSRPLATVTPRGPGRLIAGPDQSAEAIDEALGLAAALLASEQLGVAQWCLGATVDYAKTRIQFARPIGSFQAIKHRLADLYLEVAQAQAAARYAAGTWSEDDPDRHVASALAQAWCAQVALHAAEEALQLHGGIGMTWEHPVHLYLKRAKSDQLGLGTPGRHRADLATLIDLPAS